MFLKDFITLMSLELQQILRLKIVGLVMGKAFYGHQRSSIMKILKIITLPVTVPIAFIVLGIVGIIAFVHLLFNEEKRRTLFEL